MGYAVTSLHIEAYRERHREQLELHAWSATHVYRAMTGSDVTVDDLLGRRGERIDLINDPFALDKLADLEGGDG